MNKSGPIILIEDDPDDREIFGEILKRISSNEMIAFEDGIKALDYLNATDIHPFLIISDINLPKLSGFELRDKVFNNEQLRLKCIPYLFFTTAMAEKAVIEAYSKSIQGFFVKPGTAQELERMLKLIVEYWKHCKSPNIVM